MAAGFSGCDLLRDFGILPKEEEEVPDPPAPEIININTVTDGVGEGWTFTDSTLTITASGDYRIEGIGIKTANRIVVNSGGTANITLDNVNIDVSEVENTCAFDTGNATVTLTLSGNNILKSNGAAAGLQVNAGAALTITSGSGNGSEDGSLQAFGGQDQSGARGAGIGGATATSAGTITINGGTIEARGAYDPDGSGAGIGGGRGGYANVAITGGTVIAIADAASPSIGVGVTGGSIAVSGGAIIANAAIGIGNAEGWTKTTIIGVPVIFANAIQNGTSNGTTRSSDPANGISAGGATVSPGDPPGSMGIITLIADFAIPVSAVLTIPPGRLDIKP